MQVIRAFGDALLVPEEDEQATIADALVDAAYDAYKRGDLSLRDRYLALHEALEA